MTEKPGFSACRHRKFHQPSAYWIIGRHPFIERYRRFRLVFQPLLILTRKYSPVDRSSLTSRMVLDSPSPSGGGPMARLALSHRQRGELEDIVSHTPLAKERCRAQALLWLAEGSDVAEVAERLDVSRQTIYNWRSRFQERAELDLRARLLDAPRLGRPRAASGTIDERVAAVIDDDPRNFGYHATVWTAPLLSRYLHDHHGIEVSERTVGRAIDRLGIVW